jgi:hypothetical protein
MDNLIRIFFGFINVVDRSAHFTGPTFEYVSTPSARSGVFEPQYCMSLLRSEQRCLTRAARSAGDQDVLVHRHSREHYTHIWHYHSARASNLQHAAA